VVRRTPFREARRLCYEIEIIVNLADIRTQRHPISSKQTFRGGASATRAPALPQAAGGPELSMRPRAPGHYYERGWSARDARGAPWWPPAHRIRSAPILCLASMVHADADFLGHLQPPARTDQRPSHAHWRSTFPQLAADIIANAGGLGPRDIHHPARSPNSLAHVASPSTRASCAWAQSKEFFSAGPLTTVDLTHP